MALKADDVWSSENIDLLVQKRIARDSIFRTAHSHKTGWLLILSDLRKCGVPKTFNRVNIKRQWFKICEIYKKMQSNGNLSEDVEPYYAKLHKFFTESQPKKNNLKNDNKIESVNLLNHSKYADRWSTERSDILIDRRIARNSLFNRRRSSSSAWETVLSDLLIFGESKSLTIQQVKKKWDNLCFKYKKEKQSPGSIWPHFSKLNDFFNNETGHFLNEDINKCFVSVPECYDKKFTQFNQNCDKYCRNFDRWTKRRTLFLIERRKIRDAMFDGRGLSGWQAILSDFQEEGISKDITVYHIKKKWENLCTRYKVIKDVKPNSNWEFFKKLDKFFKGKSTNKQNLENVDNIKPETENVDWADDWDIEEHVNGERDKLSKCRLCQQNNSDHSLADDKNLCDRITACTSIKVLEVNENLPTGICEICKSTIDKFHDFLVQCHTVDNELRTSISEIKIKKEKEPIATDVYECCECPVSFSTVESLEIHLKSHKMTSRFHCKICSVSFTRQSALYSHIKRHFETNNPVNEANDETSDYLFEDDPIDEKTDEIESSTTQIPNLFPCEVCSKVFERETDLRRHLDTHSRTIHGCPRDGCGKTYLSLTSLRNHERKHLGLHSFLCVICGKGFVTKVALKLHEKIHSDLKEYICDICSSGFSIMSNLRAHIKKHHEGHRFYCSQCPKEFLTKSSLQRHELVHTGIKDFVCDTCSSAFYTNKELIKHKRYHNGERLYHCKQCFKTFYEKHHLTVHIRTHTGERPYECKVPDCGKAFRESNKLARHVKVIHRIIN